MPRPWVIRARYKTRQAIKYAYNYLPPWDFEITHKLEEEQNELLEA